MTNLKTQIKILIENSQKIVITSHKSPDDDAISSLLSIYYYIKEKHPQKKVSMVVNGNKTGRHQDFKNYSKIKFVAEISDHLNNADLVIFTDGCQYDRFSNSPQLIASNPAKKICIDHHPNPPDIFDLVYINVKATSTIELIYDIFFANTKLSKQISHIILLGILGDTGTFNYVRPDQSHIFSLAKTLIETSQLDIQTFKSQYDKISQTSFLVIQELIKNTSFHSPQNLPPFQTSFISRSFSKKNKFNQEDISEGVHVYMATFLRKIDDFNWGIVTSPINEADSSINLRSLPKSVNVRMLMQDMGIGGGHDRAAGGKIDNSNPQKSLNTIIKWIKSNTLHYS